MPSGGGGRSEGGSESKVKRPNGTTASRTATSSSPQQHAATSEEALFVDIEREVLFAISNKCTPTCLAKQIEELENFNREEKTEDIAKQTEAIKKLLGSMRMTEVRT